MKKNAVQFLFLMLAISCGKKVETIQPTFGEITESVYASGRVKADEQYNVFPTVTGILKSIQVEAGDTVNAGDTLFVIDNMVSQLNSESMLTTLELSRENNSSGSDKLYEMELAVNQAFERYQLDSSLYARQKKLWDQGIGAKVDFEQRELGFKNSKMSYESAQARFGQVKTQLKSDLRKAEIGYDLSKKGVNDFVLRSEITGRVFDVLKEKNELVTPQSALAVIGKSNAFIIELQVDEYDISRIMIDQKVLVTMDSHQGELFEAMIVRINPIMNDKTRTFTVEAKFKEAPKNLFPNLTVEGNIVLHVKQNALTIPRKFLEEGKYVYVKKDERREVKIGLSDYQKAEIVEGLDSSQTIYLPPAK